MKIEFNCVTIYAKNVEKTVNFYAKYFDFSVSDLSEETFTILDHESTNVSIFVHQAAKGVRHGQACIKLVFNVPSVDEFKEHSKAKGLNFGVIHRGDGYAFSNTKDPNGNNVQISSRVFK